MAVYGAGGDRTALSCHPTLISEQGGTNPQMFFSGGYNGTADMYLTDSTTQQRINVQEAWIHFNYFGDPGGTGTIVTRVRNSSNVENVRLTWVEASNALNVQYRNASSVWVDLPNPLGGLGGYNDKGTYDIRVKIGGSGVGRIEWYCNSVFIGAAIGINTSHFGDINNVRWNTGGGITTAFSQILIASENTIGWNIVYKFFNANGDMQEWTGNYTDIDEQNGTTITDYISSDIVGEISLFQGPAFGAIPTGTVIKAVSTSLFGRNDGTGVGPQEISGAIKQGVNLYETPTIQALYAGNDARQIIYDVDPATSLPWTGIGAVNASQFGFVSKAGV